MSVPTATVSGMARPSKLERTWSDAQLTDAVADSSNWRNVMRKLGLNATSAGVIRIVRRDVERLGLDTSHFRGKRIWSDGQLRRAVMNSHSWDELLDALGLAPGSGDARIRVKAHAIRLGLDLSQLENPLGNSAGPAEAQPDLRYLRDAATSLAASWFSLCGFSVAIPAGPWWAAADPIRPATGNGGFLMIRNQSTGSSSWTATWRFT